MKRNALIGLLVILLMGVAFKNTRNITAEEKHSEPLLIKQWQAGDGAEPETYQLWLVNGQEHLVVLPR